MPVSIIVGGQFGSEGKGKVAHYFAESMKAAFVVRCGGSNSGHTVIDKNGNPCIFRHLPTAAILSNTKLAIAAGSYIDKDILLQEILATEVDESRLFIDPFAVIITSVHKQQESLSGLTLDIGSTGSGTGAAVMSRIKRANDTVFAKDIPEFAKYIKQVNQELRTSLNNGGRIIIEGTQGFGLSPIHSSMNPFVTSRDTTAAGFLAETGLSPLDVDDIIMVIRAFPIRVAGNSGPLPNEIDWETISNHHGKGTICERSSVTDKVRRVAVFDPEVVKMAIYANNPTQIVINHVDYLPSDIPVSNFIKKVSKQIGRDIHLIGTSPSHLSHFEE